MSRDKIMEGINLPPNHEKLNYVETVVDKFKKRIEYYKGIGMISQDEYIELHKLIVQVLEYVGELSMPAFNIRDEVEKRYFTMYKNSPELAKKLWLDHYHDIHKPFNTIKNRCFSLLEQMDNLYTKANKTSPPIEF